MRGSTLWLEREPNAPGHPLSEFCCWSKRPRASSVWLFTLLCLQRSIFTRILCLPLISPVFSGPFSRCSVWVPAKETAFWDTFGMLDTFGMEENTAYCGCRWSKWLRASSVWLLFTIIFSRFQRSIFTFLCLGFSRRDSTSGHLWHASYELIYLKGRKYRLFYTAKERKNNRHSTLYNYILHLYDKNALQCNRFCKKGHNKWGLVSVNSWIIGVVWPGFCSF